MGVHPPILPSASLKAAPALRWLVCSGFQEEDWLAKHQSSVSLSQVRTERASTTLESIQSIELAQLRRERERQRQRRSRKSKGIHTSKRRHERSSGGGGRAARRHHGQRQRTGSSSRVQQQSHRLRPRLYRHDLARLLL